MRTPPPPKGLSKEARDYWATVHAEYELDKTQCKTLALACEALDELRRAQDALVEFGPVIVGPEGGVKANPAAAQVRDTRAQFLAAMKNLNLDIQPPALGRPGRKGG